jgi:hypothetical protein
VILEIVAVADLEIAAVAADMATVVVATDPGNHKQEKKRANCPLFLFHPF